MDLKEETIEALMQAFAKSGLAKMTVKDGEQELSFTAMGAVPQKVRDISVTSAAPAVASVPAAAPAGPKAQEQAGSTEAGKAADQDQEEVSGVVLNAPMAGIFHRAAKEGDKPLVEAGQSVQKGQTVALMEAMKMVSEIKAPVSGVVREILAVDGKFCEYHQPLMRFEESAHV